MPDYTIGGATARDVWTYSKRFTTSIDASEELQIAADTTRGTYSTSYVILKEVAIYRKGRIRVTWEYWAEVPVTVCTRLFINGSAVGSEHCTDSLYAQSVEEFTTVDPTDRVQLGGRTTNTSGRCFVRNFRIYYSEAPEYIVVLD